MISAAVWIDWKAKRVHCRFARFVRFAVCRFVHLSSNLPLQFREFGFSLWVQHSPANYTFGRLDKLDKLQLWILFAAMLFLKIDFCTWRKCAVWWWLGFQPPSLLKLLIGASDWISTHTLLVCRSKLESKSCTSIVIHCSSTVLQHSFVIAYLLQLFTLWWSLHAHISLCALLDLKIRWWWWFPSEAIEPLTMCSLSNKKSGGGWARQ